MKPDPEREWRPLSRRKARKGAEPTHRSTVDELVARDLRDFQAITEAMAKGCYLISILAGFVCLVVGFGVGVIVSLMVR